MIFAASPAFRVACLAASAAAASNQARDVARNLKGAPGRTRAADVAVISMVAIVPGKQSLLLAIAVTAPAAARVGASAGGPYRPDRCAEPCDGPGQKPRVIIDGGSAVLA